jgi:hypothetical protein
MVPRKLMEELIGRRGATGLHIFVALADCIVGFPRKRQAGSSLPDVVTKSCRAGAESRLTLDLPCIQLGPDRVATQPEQSERSRTIASSSEPNHLSDSY